MTPIRILLVAPSLNILGGQAIQADLLCRQLSRQPGLELEFQPIDPLLPGPLRALQQVKYVRTLVTELFYGFTLLFKIPRCSIVHVFGAGFFSFLLAPAPAILLGKVFGKRVVLHYHDGRAEDHLKNWPGAAAIIGLADAVVVPSRFLVDLFARYGILARSIFNILDTSRFHYRERPRPRPILLHNRGLELEYNVPCSLRAFALVQQRYPDASLTIAHNGSLRAELERLAAGLDLANVRFVGKVSPDRVPDLYDAADVYIMSPDLDNMPGSVLECFASGLPVVSTNAGGVPYILADGETGLLAGRGDHQALAACVLRLIEEESLASRLTATARRECDKYSAVRAGADWLKLYRKLAFSKGKDA